MKTLGRTRDRDDIVRRLRALRADSPRHWGRMSPHQMVCHLGDSCHLLTGEVLAVRMDTPVPRPILKWVSLYLPMRWPRGLPTTPELDPHREGTRPAAFDADVAALVARLEDLPRQSTSLGGREHPVFGWMSRRAWLRWAYLHADHHLRQFGV